MVAGRSAAARGARLRPADDLGMTAGCAWVAPRVMAGPSCRSSWCFALLRVARAERRRLLLTGDRRCLGGVAFSFVALLTLFPRAARSSDGTVRLME